MVPASLALLLASGKRIADAISLSTPLSLILRKRSARLSARSFSSQLLAALSSARSASSSSSVGSIPGLAPLSFLRWCLPRVLRAFHRIPSARRCIREDVVRSEGSCPQSFAAAFTTSAHFSGPLTSVNVSVDTCASRSLHVTATAGPFPHSPRHADWQTFTAAPFKVLESSTPSSSISKTAVVLPMAQQSSALQMLMFTSKSCSISMLPSERICSWKCDALWMRNSTSSSESLLWSILIRC
mmetsp:Transcript_46621/g.110500  ORF Transcript_46621/g.110500 Transcript_46621/m.110500 type:complete len:242 (-) Transcript_46621:72-797(-)